MTNLPQAQGLYDPAYEHDSCGVAFVVDMHGGASHDIVKQGLTALHNLDHRGATGAEANVGDGAGIVIQVPDRFLRAVVDFDLPAAGTYAMGTAFLPKDPEGANAAVKTIEALVEDEKMRVLGWRDVPTNNESLGSMAVDAEPTFRQLFIASRDPGDPLTGLDLERRAFVLRKRIEHETTPPVYFPSLSGRTLNYKGMLTCDQLSEFYPDLLDERLESARALVHRRVSTKTVPSWPRAHP